MNLKKLSAKVLICTLTCLVLGIASGIGTASSVKTWFPSIIKPSWNPPSWLFGPVWTILYILMGIAIALIWHTPHPKQKTAIRLFIFQFCLNLAWSFIFFTQHQIGWAFVEITCIWIALIFTIFAFSAVNKNAAYLLLPYICWVSFAAILNGTIWYLNR